MRADLATGGATRRVPMRVWDLEAVVNGTAFDRSVRNLESAGPEPVYGFTEALAYQIKELQRERNRLRDENENMRRECDGLRLALKRSG